MTSTQSAKYNSYHAVDVYLGDNFSDLAGIPKLVTAAALLKDLLEDLDTAIQLQDTDTTGSTLAKKAARDTVISQAVPLAGALAAYGESINDDVLEKAANVAKSDLDVMGDDALSGRLGRYKDLGAEHLTALDDFGIDGPKLAAYAAALTTWRGWQGKVENAIGDGEEGTKEIGRLMPKIDNLLSDTIDRLVLLVAASKPSFGDGYNAVREIVDAATQTRALEVTVYQGAAPGTPLGGVTALINPGNVQKVTSDNGTFYVQNLAPGSYTLQLSKNGFAALEDGFVVNAGERTRLTLGLVSS